MHKYILAIMTCLILLKAISADPVKAAENPEQKEMQQRIEQHFRTKAEHFGLKTEGKDLKEVRKEITIIEEAERMYGEQHKRFVYKQKEKQWMN